MAASNETGISFFQHIRGDTDMTSTLMGGGEVRQNEMLSDVGVGVSKCSGRPIFIFLLKKIEFAL